MNHDIELNFSHYPPKPGQPEKYQRIRDKAKELALLIDAECPPSRERSIAITDLENSVMWANAAIARHSTEETSNEVTSVTAYAEPAKYLRGLAETLMGVPPIYGTDQGDVDTLLELAAKLDPHES